MDGDREKRWRKREIWRERDMKIWGRREGDNANKEIRNRIYCATDDFS